MKGCLTKFYNFQCENHKHQPTRWEWGEFDGDCDDHNVSTSKDDKDFV